MWMRTQSIPVSYPSLARRSWTILISALRARKPLCRRTVSSYIHSAIFGSENIQRLEFILQHANHQPGCILRNKVDKLLVKPMIEAIIREYVNRNLYSKEIITQLINTIIIVVARNIAMFLPQQVDECSDDKSLDILQYIQANIYQTGKIRAKEISQHFGISESYLGRYIKKHTNETMQQYILSCLLL